MRFPELKTVEEAEHAYRLHLESCHGIGDSLRWWLPPLTSASLRLLSFPCPTCEGLLDWIAWLSAKEMMEGITKNGERAM